MFTQHAPTHIHCEERNNHISSLSDIKPTDVTINYKLSKFLIEFENGTWHFIISLSYLTCLNLLPAIVGRHLFPSSCMSSCQFVSIFLIFTLPKTLLCYQIFLDVGKRTGRGTVFSLGSMHSSWISCSHIISFPPHSTHYFKIYEWINGSMHEERLKSELGTTAV
jgi:hypothetical protein